PALGPPIVEVTREQADPRVPIAIIEVSNETVPNGLVVAQSPAPDVLVAQAGSVRLEVSSGPENRPVPEMSGLSVEGAAFRLGKAGLLFGPVTPAEDPTVPAGAVISSVPASGTKVAKDTPIALTVSVGPAPLAMPEVTNTQEAAATEVLKAAGFLVDVAGQLVVAGDPGIGNVFGQYPVAGTPYRPGQIVTIVVGRVPPPRRAAPTVTTPSVTSTTNKPTTSTTQAGG
ncbi:MAG: PASTA domain-containing protein, partial [Microthrixaceae bacterium]